MCQEQVSQSQRISFIRFKQTFLPLLNRHDVNRDIQILKKLLQRVVAMACFFKETRASERT